MQLQKKQQQQQQHLPRQMGQGQRNPYPPVSQYQGETRSAEAVKEVFTVKQKGVRASSIWLFAIFARWLSFTPTPAPSSPSVSVRCVSCSPASPFPVEKNAVLPVTTATCLSWIPQSSGGVREMDERRETGESVAAASRSRLQRAVRLESLLCVGHGGHPPHCRAHTFPHAGLTLRAFFFQAPLRIWHRGARLSRTSELPASCSSSSSSRTSSSWSR